MTVNKILVELKLIRKELHGLRKDMESKEKSDILQKVIKQAKLSQKATGRNSFLLEQENALSSCAGDDVRQSNSAVSAKSNALTSDSH